MTDKAHKVSGKEAREGRSRKSEQKKIWQIRWKGFRGLNAGLNPEKESGGVQFLTQVRVTEQR